MRNIKAMLDTFAEIDWEFAPEDYWKSARAAGMTDDDILPECRTGNTLEENELAIAYVTWGRMLMTLRVDVFTNKYDYRIQEHLYLEGDSSYPNYHYIELPVKHSTSEYPLTLKQLILILDNSVDTDGEYRCWPGLILPEWLAMISDENYYKGECQDRDEINQFLDRLTESERESLLIKLTQTVNAESDIYPQLKDVYEICARKIIKSGFPSNGTVFDFVS